MSVDWLKMHSHGTIRDFFSLTPPVLNCFPVASSVSPLSPGVSRQLAPLTSCHCWRTKTFPNIRPLGSGYGCKTCLWYWVNIHRVRGVEGSTEITTRPGTIFTHFWWRKCSFGKVDERIIEFFLCGDKRGPPCDQAWWEATGLILNGFCCSRVRDQAFEKTTTTTTFRCFILLWGPHAWWCSGAIPDTLLRSLPWQYSGDHMRYQGLN